MNTIRYLGFFVCVVFFKSHLLAQSDIRYKIVEVDSLTNTINETFPMDIPIVIKFKSDEIPQLVMCYVDSRQYTFDDLVKKNLEQNKDNQKLKEASSAEEKERLNKDFADKYAKFRVLDRANITQRREKGVNFVYLDINGLYSENKLPVVGPNKYVTVVVFYPEKKVREIFYELLKKNEAKAQTLYDDLTADGSRYDQNFKCKFAEMKEMAGSPSLVQNFNKLNELIAADELSQQKHNCKNPSLDLDLMCDSCWSVIAEDFPDLRKQLLALPFAISERHLGEVLKGKTSFLNTSNGSLSETTYDVRLKNYRRTIAELDSAIKALYTFQTIVSGAAIDNDINTLYCLKSHAEGQITNIKLIQAKTKEIDDEIDSFNMFLQPRKFAGSSNLLNMLSRAQARITPDLGLVAYGFQRDFWGIAPYLGLHINFRPMNTSLRFKGYPNKTFFSPMSVALGYTLNKIESNGKRNDFFNKGSLMLGMGYKLSHSIRLNAGALVFYSSSPNPVSERQSLTSTPYFGLSVDASLTSILNGFNNLLTFSPFSK